MKISRKNLLYILAVIAFFAGGALYIQWQQSNHNKDKDTAIIGVLLFADHPVIDELWKGFEARTRQKFTVEGKKVTFDIKNAGGNSAELRTIAAYFRDSNPDAIYVVGLPAAQALKAEIHDTPVFFGGPPDPVGAGLVSKLKDHNSNFTGTRFFPPSDKLIDTFKILNPGARKLGILHNPSEANSLPLVQQITEYAEANGLEVIKLGASSATEIEARLAAISSNEIDGLFLPTDNLVYSMLDRIIGMTQKAGVPVFSVTEQSVSKGAQFAIGADYFNIGELTADLAALYLLQKIPTNQIDVMDVTDGNLFLSSEDYAQLFDNESSLKIKIIPRAQ